MGSEMCIRDRNDALGGDGPRGNDALGGDGPRGNDALGGDLPLIYS